MCLNCQQTAAITEGANIKQHYNNMDKSFTEKYPLGNNHQKSTV
jgi:hypothetical protein